MYNIIQKAGLDAGEQEKNLGWTLGIVKVKYKV
jgi:hypothetical protein